MDTNRCKLAKNVREYLAKYNENLHTRAQKLASIAISRNFPATIYDLSGEIWTYVDILRNGETVRYVYRFRNNEKFILIVSTCGKITIELAMLTNIYDLRVCSIRRCNHACGFITIGNDEYDKHIAKKHNYCGIYHKCTFAHSLDAHAYESKQILDLCNICVIISNKLIKRDVSEIQKYEDETYCIIVGMLTSNYNFYDNCIFGALWSSKQCVIAMILHVLIRKNVNSHIVGDVLYKIIVMLMRKFERSIRNAIVSRFIYYMIKRLDCKMIDWESEYKISRILYSYGVDDYMQLFENTVVKIMSKGIQKYGFYTEIGRKLSRSDFVKYCQSSTLAQLLTK